jgi:hypothetical protein
MCTSRISCLTFTFFCVALAAPCSALSWDNSQFLVPSPEVSNLMLIVTTIVMMIWMSRIMKSIFATFELNSAVYHESIVRVDSANLRMEELEILPQSHLQQLLRARSSLPPVLMDSVTLPLSVVWDSLQVSTRACVQCKLVLDFTRHRSGHPARWDSVPRFQVRCVGVHNLQRLLGPGLSSPRL